MNNLRIDFPWRNRKKIDTSFVYFDNAATTQKPRVVLNAMAFTYSLGAAPAHRGIYQRAEAVTRLYEQARGVVAEFINADSSEIVFTRNTTESINCIAATLAAENVKKGDEILITELEHHSNIIPWQQVCKKNGAILNYIPVNNDGTLDLSSLPALLTSRTKLVSVAQVSNAVGTQNDIECIIRAAHAVGAKIFIDAAQSAPHQRIDVQKLDVDFLAFSGHKMLGPTGIGVLYINKRLHDQMQPYQFGGGMVYSVDFQQASWLAMPRRMEAGTQAVEAAIGLAAAIYYLQATIDFTALQKHEAALCAQLIDGLQQFPRIKILGPLEQLKQKGHMVSFTVDGMHPHDVAAYLDQHGICVRAGHHCAQPLANRLGLASSVRASFYFYNTPEEVEYMVRIIKDMLNNHEMNDLK